jgi:hypothetical protein
VKVTLDKAYAYAGKIYGPGETEVPDKLLNDEETKATLTEDFRKALEGEKPMNEKPETSVSELPSVDPALAAEMDAAGFGTVEAVNDASQKDLSEAVPSLNQQQAKSIKNEAKDL